MPKTGEITSEKPVYVEVSLPVPIRRNFTYRLSPTAAEGLVPGSRLLVPFGNRELTGFAVNISDHFEPKPGLSESDLKDVIEILDHVPLVTEEILQLTKWAADYYAAPWGEMLKASLPAGIHARTEQAFAATPAGMGALGSNRGSKGVKRQVLEHVVNHPGVGKKEISRIFGTEAANRVLPELVRTGHVTRSRQTASPPVKEKRRKAVRLITVGIEPDEKPLSNVQHRVIEALSSAGGEMLFTDLLGAAETGASPITTLAKRGKVEIYVAGVRRNPLSDFPLPEQQELILNNDQSFVLSEIEKALDRSNYRAFLLHGVTGSGKTEVYIRAMRSALGQGRSSLMLVPEIALTPIFSRRLLAAFGEKVAILHSSLSPGERLDEWRRIRNGDARIVIGTRSAAFAPLDDIGLLIVDEEHDPSYRQNESPYYHARDVSVMRAYSAGAVIVLGSATPALETYHNAHTGKYQYLRMQNRIGGRPLAVAELVDMREAFKRAGKDVLFSPQLIDAVKETYSRGEQTIILLNRRGYSSFVLCRSCGESIRCRNCEIMMTWHKRDGKLICHYCGHNADTPANCPFCESEYLYFIGHGTEQLEEKLKAQFRDLRIARVDRDSMRRKGEMAKTLLAFDRGEIDLLVGTQMLAKGHDFHNVTLVGVISVDTGLGLPDFRSAERTFQLLTQVAGRAGRGELPGRVMIQTYYPEHYALRHAVSQDFEGFYAEEIRFREQMSYPPFVVLASLMFHHRTESYARRSAAILRNSLDHANTDRLVRILGPAPAPISRIRNEYRIQLIIKSPGRKELRNNLDRALEEAETRGCDLRILRIEIDPVDLM